MPKHRGQQDGLLVRALKALTSLPLPGRSYTSGATPNWAQMLASWTAQYTPIKPEEAREGRDNSVVSICVNYIATSWQVAVPQVGAVDSAGVFVPSRNRHPLLDLLEAPEANVDGATLTWALIADYVRHGNAYAHILRSRGGDVKALEYLPARCVSPIPNETGRLGGYEYRPDGMETVRIAVEDILHIRHGLNPDLPLLGVSPLAAQYREIVTDNSYSDYAAGLARNGGIPPLVFTPRAVGDGLGGTVPMSGEEARTISDALNERFRQEPGRTRVIPGSLEMHKTGISPNEMALTDVRAMPETRIPAALGLPPILLQLYTGIQKSTYNNSAEATMQGWRGCIIPMQRVFAAAMTRQVLRRMRGSGNLTLRWDTSTVPELQEDVMQLREAARADVVAGILTVDEARAQQGLGPHPEPAPAPAPDPQPEPTKSLRRSVKRDAGEGDLLSIYDVAEMHRRRLLADETAAVDEMALLWLAAYRRVERLWLEAISAWEEDGDPQDAILALESRLAAIRAVLQDLSDRGAAVVEGGQRSMIGTMSADIPALVRAAGGGEVPWSPVPADTFEALVGLSGDGSPLTAVLESAGGAFVSDLRQALLDGIAQGENPRTVAARMEGIAGGSRARYETIARTEMLRAARESARRTYAANNDVLEGYVRLSAADDRTCVACWALHGTIHATSERMPTHPSCRCAMVPRVKPLSQIVGDDSLPDERPVIRTGPDLFASLPEDAQAAILGPGRMEQYRGGTPLSAFAHSYLDPQWGPSVRVAPLRESAAHVPAVAGAVPEVTP